MYCKFGNFRKNFIFTKSIKTHTCDIKNSRQGRDLHISVNYREISPITHMIMISNQIIKYSWQVAPVFCSITEYLV